MEVLLVIAPFVVLGIAVMYIAFSGGPSEARHAYLTRGGRGFSITIVLLYVALGVAVPAVVIASRGQSEGGVGTLRTEKASKTDERGKELFVNSCKACHNLDAVQAQGVTGPDLDELGQLDAKRVLNAIKNGGTGQDRMPANLLQGEDAKAVSEYVARVAGQ